MQDMTQSNSYSRFYSNNGNRGYDDDGEMMYSFATSPSASVDCTLSLGTPSTRAGGDGEKKKRSNNFISNFGWNILGSQKQKQQPQTSSSAANGQRGGVDPLLSRRCANCDTTSTPLWRNGPRGPKSLCNACGIRFKKEERRATAASACSNGGEAHGAHLDSNNQYMMNGSSWGHHQAQKTPYYPSAYANEYQYVVEEDDGAAAVDQETMQFLSWRINVADRPGLVHDFNNY